MGTFIRFALSVALLIATDSSLSAQTREGVDILLSKARSLEARGRMDLAAQNWNQVLMVNPTQTEALEGLARLARQNGDAEALHRYLDRLRRINPGNPAIDAIEKAHVLMPQELKLLDEAGRLAGEGKPDEAMAVYRRVFGDEPPLRWAEAFFETEAASTGGRDRAIVQLRDRSSRDAANELYRLWLARLLTYDPDTRKEGFRLLESIQGPGAIDQARSAWRQALGWDKDNPEAEESLDTYVRRYPDRELQNSLNLLRGFRALREKDFATAQGRFEEAVRLAPTDASAIIGLGFVRLGLKKFDQALASFTKARELAPDRADAMEGYETARFWIAMQRGAALQSNQPDAALAAYEEAAALRPGNEQASLAVAQMMQRRGNLAEAQARFEQVVKASPDNVDALTGLAFVRLAQKAFDAAASAFARAQLLDPERREIDEGYRTSRFWGLMQQGAAALAQNRTDAAIARYKEALTIDPGAKDALLALADANRRRGNTPEAREVYRQITVAHPTDVRGWLGLMKMAIDANDPRAALDTAQSIPQSTRSQLDRNPEYLARLAQALYSTNQSGNGDRALRSALDAATRSDSDEALDARFAVASLLMTQSRNEEALSIYQHAAAAHPDNTTAWEGMIGAYTRTRDASKAMAALRSMPQRTYEDATHRPGFLNGVASVYSALGYCVEAEGLLTHAIDLEHAAGRRPPPGTQLQLAGVFMREGRHERAGQTYRDVLTADSQSVDGWRGYISALHNARQDDSALTEVQRTPASVRKSLMSDPAFLRLLGGIHGAVGNNARAVELLQEAQTRYRASGQPSPADLDVHLAWAMVADRKSAGEVPAFIAAVRARTDLGKEQGDALDEISATWTVHVAEEAMRAEDPVRAMAILTEARRDIPGNVRIRAALASVYLQQRQYDRALDVYRSWGFAGATAADYRTAAGIALAARRNIVAEKFLWEGRQRWPNDPELLHMTALHALSHEDYDATEHYLIAALAAVRREESSSVPRPSNAVQAGAKPKAPTANLVTPDLLGETSCRAEATAGVGSRESGDAPMTATAARERPRDDRASISARRIQDELDLLRHRNAASIDLASPLTIREGDPGVNRLIVRDIVSSGAVTIGNTVRVGVDAHMLDISSGTADGRSGYRYGSLPRGAVFSTQEATGWAGEVQVAGDRFGFALGMSPKAFLVQNWTAGFRIGSPDDSVRFFVAREAVKDSLLSYAGARDPRTGIVWGGVVSDSGAMQFGRDDSGNGQYASIGASALHGTNVADNWSAQGTAGAYWRVVKIEHGGLSLGANVTAMHYDKNLNFFSLGHGGYFSPQRYVLAAVPISWLERRSRLEYEVTAGGGIQSIKQDGAPFDPTRSNSVEPPYDPDTRRGANYNVSFRLAYDVAPRVYVEAFAGANNARDFASRSLQIRLKFFLNSIPAGTRLHVKPIPDWSGHRPVAFD